MTPDDFQPWLTRWRLTADGPGFTSRFGSALLPVISEGRPAMLKLAAHVEEINGAALMDWYQGRGAARVFARDANAVLLERLVGTASLADMARAGRDDEATAILCDAAGDLHAPRGRPTPPTLVPLLAWFRALGEAAVASAGIYARAHAVSNALLAAPRDVVVLHGDLHHDNVLDAGDRGWLAIDPKGLIGERSFEYANLFRNPDIDIALAPGRMARQMANVVRCANVDPRRLLEWIFAYACLGAAWSSSSGHDPAPGLAIAAIAEAALTP